MKSKDEKLLKLLGKRIKFLRKKEKISQAQLAFEAGIPRLQVSRIERGAINTGVLTLVAIAEALNFQTKELLNF